MVEEGDDDLGVWGDVVVQGNGQIAEELGGRRAEDNTVWCSLDIFGYRFGAFFEEAG